MYTCTCMYLHALLTLQRYSSPCRARRIRTSPHGRSNTNNNDSTENNYNNNVMIHINIFGKSYWRLQTRRPNNHNYVQMETNVCRGARAPTSILPIHTLVILSLYPTTINAFDKSIICYGQARAQLMSISMRAARSRAEHGRAHWQIM